MHQPAAPSPAPRAEDRFPIRFAEFVAMVAALMACNALSIDPMLPALPDIGRDLAIGDPNHRQWIIIAYFLGMAGGSLLYGTLSDRFGRRRVLLTCMSLFMAATLFCALASSFAIMLAGRVTAGFFAAGARIVAVSVVRDRFHGDRMASVMSLIFIIFILVPILAPAMGQLILYVAGWRWIFGVLLAISAATTLWAALRLPETMDPRNRVEIRRADIVALLTRIVSHRGSMGYMLATGVILASTIAFISSVQQIFFDIFDAAAIFPYLFALMAASMGVGSFFNSRLVQRFGARRMSQGSMIAMIAITAVHSAIGLAGWESLPIFCVFQSATMVSFAFTSSNFSAISMEPFARGAGLAASFQAFLTTIISSLLGAVVGAAFDGTTVPLTLGICAFAILSLMLVLWGERGRLFTRPGLHGQRPLPGEV